MIYLRTFSIAIILAILSFFSWRCSQDEPVTNNSIVNNQADGSPCKNEDDEYISFEIFEHVIIHPFDDNPPTEEDRLIATITHCNPYTSPCNCGSNVPCNSGGQNNCSQMSAFQTPSAYRPEGGNSVNTMYFWFTGTAKWNCVRSNALLFALLQGSGCTSTPYYPVYDTHVMGISGSYQFNSTSYELPEESRIYTRGGADVTPPLE